MAKAPLFIQIICDSVNFLKFKVTFNDSTFFLSGKLLSLRGSELSCSAVGRIPDLNFSILAINDFHDVYEWAFDDLQ